LKRCWVCSLVVGGSGGRQCVFVMEGRGEMTVQPVLRLEICSCLLLNEDLLGLATAPSPPFSTLPGRYPAQRPLPTHSLSIEPYPEKLCARLIYLENPRAMHVLLPEFTPQTCHARIILFRHPSQHQNVRPPCKNYGVF
jgi:hypothetical protein